MQAAATTIDITPLKEVELGCSPLDGPEWVIESRPEIGLVALWIGDGAPLVFASVDALYVGTQIRAALEEASAGIVPPENLIVGATHTHAAPMTDGTKPALGSPDPEHMQMITDRVRAAMADLLNPANRQDATLEAARGKGKFAVNRRQVRKFVFKRPNFEWNVFRKAPDMRGPRDDIFTVVKVVGAGGAPLAVLWNYACHPVDNVRPRTVSTHFPGIVRQQLRDQFQEDLPVLYFQGFSGDVRPRPTAGPLIPPGGLYRIYVRLMQGRFFVPMKEDAYRKWCGKIAALVQKLVGKTRRIPADSYRAERVSRDREEFVSPQGAPATFQAVTIGPDFGLVAASAEMMTAYAPQVRRDLRRRYVFCVGCADDTFGYAPTEAMLGQGGYEDTLFLEHFDLDAVNPQIEANIRSAIGAVISATR